MHIGINVVGILFQIVLRGTRVSELEARDLHAGVFGLHARSKKRFSYLLVKTESVEIAGVQFIITW